MSILRRTILATVFAAISVCAGAQGSTTVTAQTTDTDGTHWANGTYSIYYLPIPNYSGPLVNSATGQTIVTNPITGSLDSTGSFSVQVVQSAFVYSQAFDAGPSAGVQITVCPQIVGAPCYSTGPLNISGSTQSVTTQINAVIQPPRISGLIRTAQAYNDTEVAAVNGNQYVRLSDGTQRCYSGSWAQCANSGGLGTITASPQYELPFFVTSPTGNTLAGSSTITTYSFNGYLGPASGAYTGDICQRINAALIAAQNTGLTTAKLDASAITAESGISLNCSVNPFGSVTLQGGEIILPAATINLLTEWPIPSKWLVHGPDELAGTSSNSLLQLNSSFIAQQIPTGSSNAGGVATVTVPSTTYIKAGTEVVLEGNGNDLDNAYVVASVPSPTTFTIPYVGSNTIGAALSLSISSISGVCGNWYASGFVTTPPYSAWAASTAYTVGNLIVPASANNAAGYVYYASTSGTSGGTTPGTFNQTVGGSTTDGGETWINFGQSCQATVTLALSHGMLSGGLPLAISGTSTVLDATATVGGISVWGATPAQYAYTTSVPASGTYTFTINYLGAAISSSATGTVTISPEVTEPAVALGVNLGNGGSLGVDDGARLEKLAVDANNIAGSVGIFSTTANENTGASQIMAKYATRKGIWITRTANGAPANFSLDQMQLYGSSNDAPAAGNGSPFNSIPWVGVDFYLGGTGFENIQTATIRPNSNPNANADGIQLGGSVGGFVAGIHCEIERNCLHFVNKGTSSQESSGITVNAAWAAAGSFATGAGLFNSIMRNDSTGAVMTAFQALARGGAAYIADDSQGGNSFVGGSALYDSSCGFYFIWSTNAAMGCSNFSTESHWNNTQTSQIFRLRTSGGTNEGQLGLDSSNNTVLTGVNGVLSLLPSAGSVTTTKTYGGSFSSSGFGLYGNNSTYQVFFVPPALSTQSYNISIPANTGTIAELNIAQTFTAAQTAPNFVSNIATGTAPYATTSTTLNTNLNANYVGGVALAGLCQTGGTGCPNIPVAPLTGTVAITANATALACTTGTASIASSTTSMVASASAAGTSDPDVWVSQAYVSTAGTVTVQICTRITDASAPSITYNIRVIP